MKLLKTQPFVIFTILACASVVAGCGPSKAEREAKERERQRLEYEEQQRKEAAIANKAITEMNQRMFSRPRPKDMDLGLSQPDAKPVAENKPAATPAAPPTTPSTPPSSK